MGGGAYINTNVYLNKPTDFTIKFMRYSTNTSYERIYGLPSNAPNQIYQTEHSSGTSDNFALANNGSTTTVQIASDNIYTFYKRSLTYSVVNNTTGSTIFTYTFSNSEPIQTNFTILLLAGYNFVTQTLKGRLYLAELFQENSRIRYLIPCYDRANNNKPGMYDIVNNIFYTNSGTGEFICGPEVE